MILWRALAAALCLLGTLGPAGAATVDATVRNPSGTPVEDAAVVLEPVVAVASKARRTVTIEQRDREFVPYLTIVETGTLVEFPNRDPFKHHIYSFSPAKLFEIKLYAGKPVLPVLFDKPGEVALGCNIHDWMEAHVLVVNTPHFGKTGADGRTRLRDVPAGSYRLRVWHPREKAATPLREIEVGNTALRLELVADPATRSQKPKPPVDADSY